MTPALELEALAVDFASDRGPITAVEDVSLRVLPGRTLCVVGESGSGKSVSILAAMGLLDPRRATVRAQGLRLGNVDLLTLTDDRRRALNGDRIAMVFQDPMTALNPYLRIGTQLTEVLDVHRKMAKNEATSQAIAMLRAVGISAPESRMRSYPHELSGGMRQRVVLAMALLCQPDVLLADEPTTALDVTIQAQVLQLIRDSQARTGMAVVLVTHDAPFAERVADVRLTLERGRLSEVRRVVR